MCPMISLCLAELQPSLDRQNPHTTLCCGPVSCQRVTYHCQQAQVIRAKYLLAQLPALQTLWRTSTKRHCCGLSRSAHCVPSPAGGVSFEGPPRAPHRLQPPPLSRACSLLFLGIVQVVDWVSGEQFQLNNRHAICLWFFIVKRESA